MSETCFGQSEQTENGMRQVIGFNQGWAFALNRGFAPMEKADAKKLAWEPVTLPHDWMISSPFSKTMQQAAPQGFFDRWGIGWYKKQFPLKKEEGKQYRLCFDGIYEHSTIWVNDVLVGGRMYGYSSFFVDITDAVADGENHVLVKVDNTAVPSDRWYAGAGIYRKVTLEVVPKEHLEKDDIFVETAWEGENAILTIHTGEKRPVRAILREAERNKEQKSAAKGAADLAASAVISESSTGPIVMTVKNPRLWSAETPQLYDLTVELLADARVLDRVTIRTGLRRQELYADRGLFINGEPVKLRGVCVHQEAGCFGTAVQKEIWRNRLEELKKIGCNSIRLAHHLYMPEMLDLCDEMGFYVYEECFDKWTGGAYGRKYPTEWKKDLTCMVKRDRNHPSILFWGVGNEVENQAYDSMLEMLEAHVSAVKELDETRPVTLAMNPHFSYPTEPVDMSKVEDIQQFVDEMKTGEIFDMDDRVERIKLIAEKVDLLSCNYQEQWYERIHRAIPDKAILGTETYMYFRGYEEKFQNFMDVNPWFDVEQLDYCIGGMIWTGIDYLGESMAYPAKGWSGAMFATDMEKRPIAWQLQSYWSKEPMIHFAVMDYSIPDEGAKEHWDYPRYVSHWEFPQFSKTVIPYMIATNCEQVEITVNEKEFLLQPTASYPNRMITGYLPYLPGTVTVIGKNGGKEVCRQVIQTPGIAVKLAFEKEEQTVTLTEGEDYQVLLKVRAYDEENRPVFRESAKVQFVVEGPARMVGVDNGDIKRAEPNANDSTHMFRGRADAAIAVTGPGRVRVTAFAEGMFAAQAVVVAK